MLLLVQALAAVVAVYFARQAARASREAIRDGRDAREEERAEALEARKARERDRHFETYRQIGDLASIVHDLRYAIYNNRALDVEFGQLRLKSSLIGLDLSLPRTEQLADVQLETLEQQLANQNLPGVALQELSDRARGLHAVTTVAEQLGR